MQDTLHKMIYNGVTGGAAGSVVDHNSATGAIVAAIVGALAPVIRDILVKSLTKLFTRKK